jgi:pyruvate carboxylase
VAALRDFPILGVRTNVPFLVRLLEDPAFVQAKIDTAFLDADGARLAESPSMAAPPFVVAAMAAGAGQGLPPGAAPRFVSDPWRRLPGWRN